MGVLYVDRMFLTMNGVEILDVESASVKRAFGTKYVPTMTRNQRNKGTVKGNLDINLSITVAVQSQLASPKLEDIDYNSQSVALTIEHGGDRYSFTDIDFVDVDQNASGVGAEGKKVFNLLALDYVDQIGNSALFASALTLLNVSAS